MDRRLRIYLAWTPEQLTEAFSVVDQLVRAGHEVVMEACVSRWREIDRQRVSSCHCMLRLPGDNPKGDFAVDSAKVLGLPVYFSLQDCLDALPKRAEVA